MKTYMYSISGYDHRDGTTTVWPDRFGWKCELCLTGGGHASDETRARVMAEHESGQRHRARELGPEMPVE